MRDLVRWRETFRREILKSRHNILKFLRRRGFLYREGTHWTSRHMNWIRQVLKPGELAEEDRVVLGEYLTLLEYKLQRRDDLDRRIEAVAFTPRYKPVVDRIGCFRGFQIQAAMVPATELGDLRRFESPRQLIRRSSPTPGSASTASTSSSTAWPPGSQSRWRPPRWRVKWSGFCGPLSTISTSPNSRTRRTPWPLELYLQGGECPGHDRRTPRNVMGSGPVPNRRRLGAGAQHS